MLPYRLLSVFLPLQHNRGVWNFPNTTKTALGGRGVGGWRRGPDTLFLPFAHLSLKLPPLPLTEFLLPPPLAHRTCQHRRSSITLDVPLPRHTVRADKGRHWVPTTVPSRQEALGEWMGRWTGGLQTPEFLETTSVMFWGKSTLPSESTGRKPSSVFQTSTYGPCVSL